MATFAANNSLTNGGAISTSNPGGVWSLLPIYGKNDAAATTSSSKERLATTGDLVLDGGNIELTAVDGFPAIVCGGNITITSRTRVTINGMVLIQGAAGSCLLPQAQPLDDRHQRRDRRQHRHGKRLLPGWNAMFLNYNASQCKL